MSLSGQPTLFGELRKTLVLAAPITAGHLSQMILGLTDTLMIGRVGMVALAAAAFAHTIVHLVFVIGIGLLSAVSVLVAHAHGAGKPEEAGEMLRRGLFLGIVSGLLMFGLLRASFPLLVYLGQPPEVITEARFYLFLTAGSLPFIMGTIAFKNYSEGQDRPWPAFWAGLTGVLLNIFLNWVFIYGNLGAPRLELDGAGWATLASRIFTVALLVAWLRLDRRFVASWPRQWLAAIPWSGLISMIKLGFPVGLQIFMEVSAFAGTTLLMGWLGVVQIAAHQIALTCAATTFMIPMGISLAVAIRVGHVLGAGQPERARNIGFGALGFVLLIMGSFALIFIFLNHGIAALFTHEEETIAMAAALLVIAGFFQLFDGAQVIAIGALRGAKDVTFPTWIIFGAYWVLALPVGSLLAFQTDLGARGLWIGLALGLGTAAVGLNMRFARAT